MASVHDPTLFSTPPEGCLFCRTDKIVPQAGWLYRVIHNQTRLGLFHFAFDSFKKFKDLPLESIQIDMTIR